MATTLDFSPLLRTAVGFDRMSRALEAAAHMDDAALSYPPYNIIQLDDGNYRVEMAVAGFERDDLEIVVHEAGLTVKSLPLNDKDGQEGTYLHRGIGRRTFERNFELAEHIKVSGAKLVNGMLFINLAREVPEALKPRKIEIHAEKGARRLRGV